MFDRSNTNEIWEARIPMWLMQTASYEEKEALQKGCILALSCDIHTGSQLIYPIRGYKTMKSFKSQTKNCVLESIMYVITFF